jgi:hypothetical protein
MYSEAIEAMRDAMPEMGLTITYGGETVEAFGGPIPEAWQDSDYGAIRAAEGYEVFYTDEPDDWDGRKLIGKSVEISRDGETRTMRVVGREKADDSVKLTLTTENATR